MSDESSEEEFSDEEGSISHENSSSEEDVNDPDYYDESAQHETLEEYRARQRGVEYYEQFRRLERVKRKSEIEYEFVVRKQQKAARQEERMKKAREEEENRKMDKLIDELMDQEDTIFTEELNTGDPEYERKAILLERGRIILKNTLDAEVKRRLESYQVRKDNFNQGNDFDFGLDQDADDSYEVKLDMKERVKKDTGFKQGIREMLKDWAATQQKLLYEEQLEKEKAARDEREAREMRAMKILEKLASFRDRLALLEKKKEEEEEEARLREQMAIKEYMEAEAERKKRKEKEREIPRAELLLDADADNKFEKMKVKRVVTWNDSDDSENEGAEEGRGGGGEHEDDSEGAKPKINWIILDSEAKELISKPLHEFPAQEEVLGLLSHRAENKKGLHHIRTMWEYATKAYQTPEGLFQTTEEGTLLIFVTLMVSNLKKLDETRGSDTIVEDTLNLLNDVEGIELIKRFKEATNGFKSKALDKLAPGIYSAYQKELQEQKFFGAFEWEGGQHLFKLGFEPLELSLSTIRSELVSLLNEKAPRPEVIISDTIRATIINRNALRCWRFLLSEHWATMESKIDISIIKQLLIGTKELPDRLTTIMLLLIADFEFNVLPEISEDMSDLGTLKDFIAEKISKYYELDQYEEGEEEQAMNQCLLLYTLVPFAYLRIRLTSINKEMTINGVILTRTDFPGEILLRIFRRLFFPKVADETFTHEALVEMYPTLRFWSHETKLFFSIMQQLFEKLTLIITTEIFNGTGMNVNNLLETLQLSLIQKEMLEHIKFAHAENKQAKEIIERCILPHFKLSLYFRKPSSFRKAAWFKKLVKIAMGADLKDTDMPERFRKEGFLVGAGMLSQDTMLKPVCHFLPDPETGNLMYRTGGSEQKRNIYEDSLKAQDKALRIMGRRIEKDVTRTRRKAESSEPGGKIDEALSGSSRLFLASKRRLEQSEMGVQLQSLASKSMKRKRGGSKNSNGRRESEEAGAVFTDEESEDSTDLSEGEIGELEKDHGALIDEIEGANILAPTGEAEKGGNAAEERPNGKGRSKKRKLEGFSLFKKGKKAKGREFSFVVSDGNSAAERDISISTEENIGLLENYLNSEWEATALNRLLTALQRQPLFFGEVFPTSTLAVERDHLTVFDWLYMSMTSALVDPQIKSRIKVLLDELDREDRNYQNIFPNLKHLKGQADYTLGQVASWATRKPANTDTYDYLYRDLYGPADPSAWDCLSFLNPLYAEKDNFLAEKPELGYLFALWVRPAHRKSIQLAITHLLQVANQIQYDNLKIQLGAFLLDHLAIQGEQEWYGKHRTLLETLIEKSSSPEIGDSIADFMENLLHIVLDRLIELVELEEEGNAFSVDQSFLELKTEWRKDKRGGEEKRRAIVEDIIQDGKRVLSPLSGATSNFIYKGFNSKFLLRNILVNMEEQQTQTQLRGMNTLIPCHYILLYLGSQEESKTRKLLDKNFHALTENLITVYSNSPATAEVIVKNIYLTGEQSPISTKDIALAISSGVTTWDRIDDFKLMTGLEEWADQLEPLEGYISFINQLVQKCDHLVQTTEGMEFQDHVTDSEFSDFMSALLERRQEIKWMTKESLLGFIKSETEQISVLESERKNIEEDKKFERRAHEKSVEEWRKREANTVDFTKLSPKVALKFSRYAKTSSQDSQIVKEIIEEQIESMKIAYSELEKKQKVRSKANETAIFNLQQSIMKHTTEIEALDAIEGADVPPNAGDKNQMEVDEDPNNHNGVAPMDIGADLAYPPHAGERFGDKEERQKREKKRIFDLAVSDFRKKIREKEEQDIKKYHEAVQSEVSEARALISATTERLRKYTNHLSGQWEPLRLSWWALLAASQFLMLTPKLYGFKKTYLHETIIRCQNMIKSHVLLFSGKNGNVFERLVNLHNPPNQEVKPDLMKVRLLWESIKKQIFKRQTQDNSCFFDDLMKGHYYYMPDLTLFIDNNPEMQRTLKKLPWKSLNIEKEDPFAQMIPPDTYWSRYTATFLAWFINRAPSAFICILRQTTGGHIRSADAASRIFASLFYKGDEEERGNEDCLKQVVQIVYLNFPHVWPHLLIEFIQCHFSASDESALGFSRFIANSLGAIATREEAEVLNEELVRTIDSMRIIQSQLKKHIDQEVEAFRQAEVERYNTLITALVSHLKSFQTGYRNQLNILDW